MQLVVNPSSDCAWEVFLKEGITSIGRGEDCDVQLAHASVRDRHAEVHVFQGRAILIEFDADGGTQRTVDLAIQPEFQVGDIQLELVVSGASSPQLPTPVRAELPSNEDEPDPTVRDRFVLIRSMVSAFGYPFRGDTRYVLASGTVVFTICDYIGMVAGIIGLLLQIGIVGFIARYAKETISVTASGHNYEPQWPDLSSWYDDIVQPVLELLIVCMLSFGPLVILQWHVSLRFESHPAAWLIAGLWGCMTFPIFYLALAIGDSLTALLNLRLLIRSITRTFWDYQLICVAVAILGAGGFALKYLHIGNSFIGVGLALVIRFYEIYCITVLARWIGLYYRSNSNLLGW